MLHVKNCHLSFVIFTYRHTWYNKHTHNNYSHDLLFYILLCHLLLFSLASNFCSVVVPWYSVHRFSNIIIFSNNCIQKTWLWTLFRCTKVMIHSAFKFHISWQALNTLFKATKNYAGFNKCKVLKRKCSDPVLWFHDVQSSAQ